MIHRNTTLANTLSGMVAIAMLFCVGCTSETPAPKKVLKPIAASFSDGVAKLGVANQEILAAFEAGTPQECDGSLHTAADLALALPQLALNEGQFDAEQMATVDTAAKALFQQFGKLHEGFHPKPGHDHGEHEEHNHEEGHDDHDHEHVNAYTEVAQAINDALTQLKNLPQ